jgi:hypothetical protein
LRNTNLLGGFLKLTEQTEDNWYYVVVQNPGISNEHFVGYTDKETGATFIPAFKTKEIAQQCFLLMPKDVMNEKYEVQAVIKEDLLEQARKNEYDVFLMDHKGSVLEKIS